jgi:X-Pro dipeptidyl-peptidase
MRLLIGGSLAACLALAGLPASAVQQPRFVDGLAQPVFDEADVVRHDAWVEVPNLDSDRDGLDDRIRVSIARPTATDGGLRLPIVMTASPYSGGTNPYPRHDVNVELFVPGAPPPPRAEADPSPDLPPYDGTEPPIRPIRPGRYERYLLPRGFIVAYAQSLGTGASTGCPTIGGVEENLAMKAVIDWFGGDGRGFDADGQPVEATWATGATAMMGTSYDGTLPIGAAVLGTEGLKAIVPIAGVSSYYDHRRSGGTVINSFPTRGTDAETLFDNILTRKHPEACAYMRDRIVGGMDRATGDYNAWWHERNYVKDVGPEFRAAVLISHGLNDFNTKPRHAARLWQALRGHGISARIWWHQGGHGDRPNQARRDVWQETLNRFFSHHLFGVDNDEPSQPRVVVEREDNSWATYDDWPVPGARPVTLSLAAGLDGAAGTLSVEGSSPPAPSTVTETLVDDGTIEEAVLVDAERSPNRLVYRTAPLAGPVHVSGVPDVSLRLSFDRPAAVVSAFLVDYRADGTSVIVVRGWADPQNRESISETLPVVPGETYTMAFELQPHDYIFPAGSRIGLVVLSSDELFTQVPPPGTRLTLTPGESTLTLPVVGPLGTGRGPLTPAAPAMIASPPGPHRQARRPRR